MWPLTVRQVIEGCGGAAVLPPELGAEVVYGATGSLQDLAPGDLFLALPFADGDAHAHVNEALARGAALALVSASWAERSELSAELQARCLIVPDVVEAFRAFAAKVRARFSGPVVCVFGSNGKTTTKEMLAAVLSSPGYSVVRTPGTDNGFLGLPRTLCSREMVASRPPDALVLEIGIDAPGAMEQHARLVAPDLTVLTALGPEHLTGLGDVETAVREELLLVTACAQARRILPLSDPEVASRPSLWRDGDIAVAPVASLAGARSLPSGVGVLLFSAQREGISTTVQCAFFPPGQRERPSLELSLSCPLPGAHNAQNLALAIAGALALGRSSQEIRAGWEGFEPPPFRSRVVPLERGILLYDDSFNASPLSVAAALATWSDAAWAERPKVAILGDMLDLGSASEGYHRELAGQLCAVPQARALLFGKAMGATREGLALLGEEERLIDYVAAGDPVGPVAGMHIPDGAVVLVKGSRGMRLERVVFYLELALAADPASALGFVRSWVTTVAITGRDLEGASAEVEAALSEVGPAARADATGLFVGGERCSGWSYSTGRKEMLFRAAAAFAKVVIVSLPQREALRGAEEGPFDIVVMTGLDPADVASGQDVEAQLAIIAQLVVRDGGPRALVVRAGDPACELLLEVAPPRTRKALFGDGKARGSEGAQGTSRRADSTAGPPASAGGQSLGAVVLGLVRG